MISPSCSSCHITAQWAYQTKSSLQFWEKILYSTWKQFHVESFQWCKSLVCERGKQNFLLHGKLASFSQLHDGFIQNHPYYSVHFSVLPPSIVLWLHFWVFCVLRALMLFVDAADTCERAKWLWLCVCCVRVLDVRVELRKARETAIFCMVCIAMLRQCACARGKARMCGACLCVTLFGASGTVLCVRGATKNGCLCRVCCHLPEALISVLARLRCCGSSHVCTSVFSWIWCCKFLRFVLWSEKDARKHSALAARSVSQNHKLWQVGWAMDGAVDDWLFSRGGHAVLVLDEKVRQ